MPNVLTTDDSTFAGGVGNWDPQINTSLSTTASPTSPDGNNVLVLTQIDDTSFNAVQAQIPQAIYPTTDGQHWTAAVDVNVPTPHAGLGTLWAFLTVFIYSAAHPGGFGEAGALVELDAGSGWHHLSIADFAVTGPGATSIALDVRVLPPEFVGGVAFVDGDVAYVGDVVLSTTTLGGWGVGQIRMGGN
jgi:hypothetical protein